MTRSLNFVELFAKGYYPVKHGCRYWLWHNGISRGTHTAIKLTPSETRPALDAFKAVTQ